MPLVTSPRFIEVHRLGVFPDRSLDIDVVFDLMIHDLDIIAGAGAVRGDVDRGGRRAGADAKFDIANARLRFATGCIANLTASRISRERVRKIRFFQPDAYISIDYAAQEVEGWRLVRRDGAASGDRRGRAAGDRRTSRCGASSPTSLQAVRDEAPPAGGRRSRPRRARTCHPNRGEDGERLRNRLHEGPTFRSGV